MAVDNMETWEHLFCKTLLHLSSRDRWTLTWQKGHLSPGPQWKEYKEQASARFHCSRCKRSWNSVHVTLLFYMALSKRRQRGGKVGTVSGCILRQDCKYCGAGGPGTPNFEDDDIEIILYNLLIHIRQQCYGEYVDDKLRQVPLHGSTQGHHRSDLCEACRLGICPWTSPKRKPEGHARRQQERRYESKEHVEIPMEPLTIASDGKPNTEYHKCRPAGQTWRQLQLQHESKEPMDFTIKNLTPASKGKPESECCTGHCCCCTVLVAFLLLLVILFFCSKFVL